MSKEVMHMSRSVIALIISLTVALAVAGQPKDEKIHQESAAAPSGAIIRTPGDANPMNYDAGTARFLLSREETGGRYSVVELAESPGYSTPLHIHKDMDEAFYVLEGTLTAQIASKKYELPAGSFVLIPKGTAHAQGNLGKTPVRVLVTTSPGGFEQFFRDRVQLFKTLKPEHPEFGKRMTSIIEKNNIEVLGPWQP